MLPRALSMVLPLPVQSGLAETGVFKLRGQRRGLLEKLGMVRERSTSSQKVHPMALAFRTRATGELFFPSTCTKLPT